MDYQSMYYKLFNRVTDIIEELKQIQQETEELAMQPSLEEQVQQRQNERVVRFVVDQD